MMLRAARYGLRNLAGFFGLFLVTSPVLAQEKSFDVPLPLPRPAQSDLPSLAPAPQPSDIEPEAETATDRIYQAACPALLSGLIEAEILPPITEDRCGLQSPYRVRSVQAGSQRVAFSSPLTVNCQMASQLQRWVERVNAYTQGVLNAEIKRVLTGTSFFCRPRNNQPGANISEHGFGNAVDVTGFELSNGQRVTLPEDWAGDDPSARAMRFAHGAACGHFTTVLGPEANSLHFDHLHVDLGCHSRTCRARICE